MKAITLNKRSWLVRIAEYGGLDTKHGWDRTDLCSLFWSTLWGLIRAPFWVTLFGGLGAGLGYLLVLHPVITLIALAQGLFLFEPPHIIAGGVYGYALFFALNHRFPLLDAMEDGMFEARQLVRTGYRSWKDKTCALVDVKE